MASFHTTMVEENKDGGGMPFGRKGIFRPLHWLHWLTDYEFLLTYQ
jgi:hypothetical protein